jgi:very-short-patch-repair endonuclease
MFRRGWPVDELCTTRPNGDTGPSRCPMPRSPALRNADWVAIAELQSGVISRGQLLDLGLSAAEAKADINTGRWQRIFPGVYATFTGPIGFHSQVWAALLYAGGGAAASHGTALWLWKLVDEAPSVIDVVVPESRRVLRQPGLRVHRRRALDQPDISSLVHPSAQPVRLRVEEAVLDHCHSVAAPTAIDLVLRATQRRTTTADRLRRSMHRRPRQRWRSLLLDVLAEVQVGVASNLELTYRRDVEHRHCLPAGTRNEMEDGPRGGHWYRDVRYRPWHVIVELDGREAHPVDGAFRDMRRDNVAAVAGDTSLRYGWRDVVGDPCGVAAQVGAVLTLGGWTGRPRRCGAACTVDR